MKKHYVEMAVSTIDDCVAIKRHLKLVFYKENLRIRIQPAYANKYSLWVSCTSFEASLLDYYLASAKIEDTKRWNY